jgi:hypothetical protein
MLRRLALLPLRPPLSGPRSATQPNALTQSSRPGEETIFQRQRIIYGEDAGMLEACQHPDDCAIVVWRAAHPPPWI